MPGPEPALIRFAIDAGAYEQIIADIDCIVEIDDVIFSDASADPFFAGITRAPASTRSMLKTGFPVAAVDRRRASCEPH
jgi:hypothetical protein